MNKSTKPIPVKILKKRGLIDLIPIIDGYVNFEASRREAIRGQFDKMLSPLMSDIFKIPGAINKDVVLDFAVNHFINNYGYTFHQFLNKKKKYIVKSYIGDYYFYEKMESDMYVLLELIFGNIIMEYIADGYIHITNIDIFDIIYWMGITDLGIKIPSAFEYYAQKKDAKFDPNKVSNKSQKAWEKLSSKNKSKYEAIAKDAYLDSIRSYINKYIKECRDIKCGNVKKISSQ